jgi:P-type Ca2+ transporter type 2C
MSLFKKLISNIEMSQSIHKIAQENWHALSVQDVLERVKSSKEGISHEEAVERLSRYGKNELPQEEKDPAWKLFIKQFNNPLMYIMMAAIAISYFTGNTSDTIFIAVVAISNVFVGFYQEHKANNSLASLKNLIKLKARIIRADLEQEVEISEIVPGDIIVIRAGDKIPADGRIIECSDFKLNEASLTGESKPVEKQAAPVSQESELADRLSMVFMGTLVEEGSARVVVVETGVKTEYGDIVRMLKNTSEEATPLQRSIVSLSKIVGIFITIVVTLIAFEGYIAGRPLQDIFATSLALFVSAVPEGLLPAITIVLTIGMRRILKYKGLVRRLAATETLGGVTVICTDKTGTLTEGKMAVSSVISANGDENNVLRLALLAIDAYIENTKKGQDKMIYHGRPTEQALLKAGVERGMIKKVLEEKYEQIDMTFFSSVRKYSASLRSLPDGNQELCVVGAPERILDRVSSVLTREGAQGKESEAFRKVHRGLKEAISKGFRVVASAYRIFPSFENHKGKLEESTEDLVLAGFITITDPVRKDAASAFQKTHRAGIRTIIITGDHKATAQAVAEEIGFNITDEQILEGHQIENMTDRELSEKINFIHLYARVSPRHKLRIVKLLQERGEVVAMFGDGVNDAPALKAADIGVAVNSEVDAAREVADIVLLDGSFATIVMAIEQGRIIFSNIRRVFLYLITQDFSQFILFLVSIGLGLPLPFLAAQLLLVNIIESGLPDLALTTEEEKEGVMDEPPRNPKESIVNTAVKHWMTCVFAISGGIAISLYYLLLNLNQNLDLTRTMLTAFFCIESLFLALSLRSFKKSILRRDIFSNKWINGAVFFSFIGLLAAIYIAPFADTLHLLPLTVGAWSTILAANVAEILFIDRFKMRFLARSSRPAG